MKKKTKQTMMRIDPELLYRLSKLKQKKSNGRLESYSDVIKRLLDEGGRERLLQEKEELLR